MGTTAVEARNTPPTVTDDLDVLFDFEVSDVFRDVNMNLDAPAKRPSFEGSGKKDVAVGLGIDEEIKVVKKRAPVAKLDENRFVLR